MCCEITRPIRSVRISGLTEFLLIWMVMASLHYRGIFDEAAHSGCALRYPYFAFLAAGICKQRCDSRSPMKRRPGKGWVMRAEPRVALFTDSYLEVNGVARTSREFTAFTNRHSMPLLCVHAAPQTERIEEGSLTRLGLKRTPIGFRIEEDQRFDLFLWRHLNLAVETVREFKPDLIHITGPSDVGLLGAYVAHLLRVPRVLSWHTNLHEYASRRLSKMTSFLPRFARGPMIDYVERQSLRLLFEYYKIGRILFAPNPDLGEMLEQNCSRLVFSMKRGVDTELFSPVKRLRRDNVFTLGYVGRIATEKNVRLLVEIEKALIASGCSNFRFVIVGAGSERAWLENNLQYAEFTGVLKGESLARA